MECLFDSSFVCTVSMRGGSMWGKESVCMGRGSVCVGRGSVCMGRGSVWALLRIIVNFTGSQACRLIAFTKDASSCLHHIMTRCLCVTVCACVRACVSVSVCVCLSASGRMVTSAACISFSINIIITSCRLTDALFYDSGIHTNSGQFY